MVYEYKKHAEVYLFYVAMDTAVISLHNLSESESDVATDDYLIETYSRGETLLDGDTTTKRISEALIN